ncbi:MAG: beta-N-acetylhexosaminidase [Hyphomicrobiaceae bacterium]
MAETTALIVGLHGPDLTEPERQFLRAARPAGIILFARNIVSHDQIRRLIGDARAAIGGDDALVLIDQEGGRVQRLRPPLGRALPPARALANLRLREPDRAREAAFLIARLLADDLRALGIDTDCAPVADRPVEGAHEIIGDRAYGTTVDGIADLAGAAADGFMEGGVVPVVKHVPGHGRATADSHLALPRVDTPRAELEETDFAPFRRLRHLPAAMTAHVVFSAIDAENPASTSAVVTSEVIRGSIGFDGLLMSDDLGMRALAGPMRARAEAVIAAGSDVALHCSGELDEMVQAAVGAGAIAPQAAARLAAAGSVRHQAVPYDRERAEAVLAAVLAEHAASAESV